MSNNKKVEFTLQKGDNEYTAVISADFKRIREATAILSSTTMQRGGENASVKIDLDYVGAGDKILFMCWESGDEIIREDIDLRLAAADYLGNWVRELHENSSVKVVTEKKS